MNNQYRTPYPNELYHFGILGMKWGVRRYQNPDGSYTDAGKARRNGMNAKDTVGKMVTPTKKDGKLTKTAAEKGLQSTKDVVDGVRNIRSTHREYHRQETPREDLSKYSDDELRKMINRMDLERRYESLKPQQVRSGKNSIDEALAYASDVVAIGASAASIVAIIMAAKKGVL